VNAMHTVGQALAGLRTKVPINTLTDVHEPRSAEFLILTTDPFLDGGISTQILAHKCGT